MVSQIEEAVGASQKCIILHFLFKNLLKKSSWEGRLSLLWGARGVLRARSESPTCHGESVSPRLYAISRLSSAAGRRHGVQFFSS